MVVQTFRYCHLGAFPAVAFPGDCSAPAWLCISFVKVLAGKVRKDAFEGVPVFWIHHIKVASYRIFLFWCQVFLAHIISFRKCDAAAISPCDNERILLCENLHIPKNRLPGNAKLAGQISHRIIASDAYDLDDLSASLAWLQRRIPLPPLLQPYRKRQIYQIM